ncbi:MAG: hypothetical protein IKZ36_05650 [Kiritimatiellae bacterium]|nr:hypothetical protein [Kiritimatiellia bacterium]
MSLTEDFSNFSESSLRVRTTGDLNNDFLTKKDMATQMSAALRIVVARQMNEERVFAKRG